MSKPLTIRELELIKQLSSVMFAEQIAMELNRPLEFVKRSAKYHNVKLQSIPARMGEIKVKQMFGNKTCVLYNKGRTKGLASFLYEHFSGAKLPAGCNVRFKDKNPMNCRFYNLETFNISDIGVKTQIKPGSKPHNAGTKGKMKPNRTSFKPGQVPHNTKHEDAITIRTDGGKQYQFTRVSKGKWVSLHRQIWEQAYGPVPAGHIITFIDGNTMNAVLENLKCISRAENVT